MAVFKRKNRMISFRVSEEEYRQLQSATLSAGARSISDYARDNLFCRCQSEPAAAIGKRVESISEALATLDSEIKRIRSRLSDPL